jgi:hypothetical protein
MDLTPLHAMQVRLELKRTAKESDYHTTLAHIRVDGQRVTARCAHCNCHRLVVPPVIIKFLLALIAEWPDANSEVITLSDGHYESGDTEVYNCTNRNDPRQRGGGQDDTGVTLS